MQKSIYEQLDTDANVFLQALINELRARDQMTHLARQLKKYPRDPHDDQTRRDLCIAYRSIQVAERKHYKAYRQLIRHFDL